MGSSHCLHRGMQTGQKGEWISLSHLQPILPVVCRKGLRQSLSSTIMVNRNHVTEEKTTDQKEKKIYQLSWEHGFKDHLSNKVVFSVLSGIMYILPWLILKTKWKLSSLLFAFETSDTSSNLSIED
uniref:Uncharacterized protein n=1 Tax=Sphaerodactylus townsendi TaxID=933632 RepID=A0ACB8F5V2_9SAUR